LADDLPCPEKALMRSLELYEGHLGPTIHTMTKHLPLRRIGIFGHVGTQNLGDEIIIAAVIQNVRSRYPDAVIRAFTFNPDDTRVRHGIEAFPIRRVDSPSSKAVKSAKLEGIENEPKSSGSEHKSFKESLKKIPLLHGSLKAIQSAFSSIAGSFAETAFLARSFKNLKGTDLLIIAGSGQLTDHSGGAWAYPYTFYKWSLLARLLGTKIAFVSIGTSWINSSLSKFFLKSALSRAQYRSCRDESSGKQVDSLGLPQRNVVVVPDLAYSLQLPASDKTSNGQNNPPVVGINPIPFFHQNMWHKANQEIYEKYVETQAGFASWLIDRGYSVRFFPTQLRADPPAIQDIIAVLNRKHPGLSGQLLVDPPVRSTDDLIAAMSRMDIVVAARYHGVLVSHLLHKPVLAVSYHPKTADLMARMGQAKCTLDIEDCTLDALISRFTFLESQRKTIAAEFELRVPFCRTALASQYDQVFGLLEQTTV